MASTVSNDRTVPLVNRLESVSPVMAKADLKNLEKAERQAIGRVVQRCFSLAGFTQKEAAALVNRDQAQVARWINGSERAQIDVIYAVPMLRRPLVIAFAEQAGEGVEVITEIRVRRSA